MFNSVHNLVLSYIHHKQISYVISQFSCLSDAIESLQAQLAGCRAQLEHWQGVATICEQSKQEELGELQKQCDQEMQSLQEALRGQREREIYTV